MMLLAHGFLLLFFLISIAPLLILFEMLLPLHATPEPQAETDVAVRATVGQASWLLEVPTYARHAAVPYFRRGGV